MANYTVGKTSELTLLSSLFGDPLTLPIWHIILFQLILWFTMGQAITRHFTISIYDFAIQRVGKHQDQHSGYVRQYVSKYDSGYAKADAVYLKRGNPALIGLILVGLFSPTPLSEYYYDYRCYS